MRKSPLSTAREPSPSSASLASILAAADVVGKDAEPLRRWTVRLPDNVASELAAIAEFKNISVNALVMVALDELLTKHGRQPIADSAPWFPAYLKRVGAGTRKQRLPLDEFD